VDPNKDHISHLAAALHFIRHATHCNANGTQATSGALNDAPNRGVLKERHQDGGSPFKYINGLVLNASTLLMPLLFFRMCKNIL